ncbi:MAG: hypothetical protein ACRDEB_04420 [Chitinophagaceae bacterium]
MNRLLFTLVVWPFIFFSACKNPGKKTDAGLALKTKADSLRQEAIHEHNRGMGGWNKIEGRQIKIQKLLDSISLLPAKTQPALTMLKKELNEANESLSKAYKEMYDWMVIMNLDSAADNPGLRAQYYTDEIIKGREITNLINNSLDKADSVLKTSH